MRTEGAADRRCFYSSARHRIVDARRSRAGGGDIIPSRWTRRRTHPAFGRRAHPTVVGIFHYDRRRNYVKPIDEKVTQEIIIPAGMEMPERPVVSEQLATGRDASEIPEPQRAQRKAAPVDRVIGDQAARHTDWQDLEGVIVDVEITDWPSATQNPRGRVIEILGEESDFGVDVEIMIRKFHLPHRFPPEVVEEAEAIDNVIPASEFAQSPGLSAISRSLPSTARPRAIRRCRPWSGNWKR